jgi:hypothetical protein
MHLRFTTRHHHWALLAGTLLAALVALCAWGGWLAAQPDLSTFLLPGAHDIRYEPVGPGMQSVLFTYDGEVIPQTERLYSALARRGWLVGQAPRREDCSDLCILGQFTLVFTRKSVFDLVSEVATVEQRGAGPYHVRVVLRRCIRLPRVGCWPPG